MDGIKLVTRADDLGSAVSANRATEEVARHRLLRNLSFLAVGPCLADAVARFRGRDDLCYGLLATVACEWQGGGWRPAAGEGAGAVRAPGGGFHASPTRLHQLQVPVADVLREVAAQLAALRATGLRVTYLDEHMGFGWLPGVKEGLADLARREGLVYRPDLAGIGPTDMSSNAAAAATVAAAVRALAPGEYVLILHPCHDDAEMRGFKLVDDPAYDAGRDRDVQRSVYCSAEVAAAAREKGVRLVRYDEL